MSRNKRRNRAKQVNVSVQVTKTTTEDKAAKEAKAAEETKAEEDDAEESEEDAAEEDDAEESEEDAAEEETTGKKKTSKFTKADLQKELNKLAEQRSQRTPHEMGGRLKQLLKKEIEEYEKREKTRAAEMISIFAAHNYYANGFTPRRAAYNPRGSRPHLR